MNKLDNHVSGNSRAFGSPIWQIAARNNLKPKTVIITDLNGVTKVFIGKDESPSRKRFKDKKQREYEAKLRKNIELSKNINFLN